MLKRGSAAFLLLMVGALFLQFALFHGMLLGLNNAFSHGVGKMMTDPAARQTVLDRAAVMQERDYGVISKPRGGDNSIGGPAQPAGETLADLRPPEEADGSLTSDELAALNDGANPPLTPLGSAIVAGAYGFGTLSIAGALYVGLFGFRRPGNVPGPAAEPEV